MLTAVVLGTGNVATQLCKAFESNAILQIVQVYGRSKEKLHPFKTVPNHTTQLEELLPADLYFLAVSDKAIQELSQKLPPLNGLVVHTSGGVSLEALSQTRKGVFYPLQTFTKGKVLDFSTIPICIEAKQKEDVMLLKKVAQSISSQVQELTSAQRAKLHLSAVLVNNFTNHLFYQAAALCKAHEIDFQLLVPLITETVEKIRTLPPYVSQTGPARRQDVLTMQGHLSQLEDPLQKKIYQLMSESIIALYEKEL